MDRRLLRAFVLCLLVAALACRDRDAPAAPTPQPQLEAPSALTVQLHGTWGKYDVQWVAPPGPRTGYELHGAIDDGPFVLVKYQPTSDGMLPPGATHATLEAFDERELAWIHVRIRALNGAQASPWSEVASVRQGLRTPRYVYARSSKGAPPVLVTWTTYKDASTFPANLMLERAESDFGADPVWRPLTVLGPQAESYDDNDVEDGRRYLYRVHREADGVESAATASDPSDRLAILAPADVTVTLVAPDPDAEPKGFRIGWANRSATANLCTVFRLDVQGTVTGTDAPVSGPFDDLTWPQWPGARYAVTARDRAGTATPGTSDYVDAPGFTRRGVLVLEASAPTVRAGHRYARDATGGIHVLRASEGLRNGVLFRPTSSGYEEHQLAGELEMLISPGLALDADGHPHVMYVLRAVTGPRTVRHYWHDGAGLRSDDLELDGTDDYPVAFGLGPGGAAHVVYMRRGPPYAPVHATNTGAGWSKTVMAVDIPDLYASPALQTSADGTLYIAPSRTVGDGSYSFAMKRPGTAWTMVTTDGLPRSTKAWFAGGDAGVADLMFEKLEPPHDRILYMRRDGAHWTTPELVATQPFDGTALRASTAMGRDGSRSLLVVAMPDAEGLFHEELFIRSSSQGWRQMRLGPSGNVTPVPSFGPDGKVSLLGAIQMTPAIDTVRIPVLVEP